MKLLIYFVIVYFIYSILKRIMFFLKMNNKSDLNTNYKRNGKKRNEKREIIEADFEEIKDEK